MKIKKIILSGLWILILLFAFGGTPAFACDEAEMAAIQAVIDSPPADLDPTNLAKAKVLFQAAKEDCAGGAAAAASQLITHIKTLLGM